MTFVSYAQNFEDVLLWRALRHVEYGRYLDIGAQDPLLDSVSRAFYDAGWRGIHVEPTATSAARLREARPDETVIEAAVTDAPGPIAFYELGGLSSGREDVAEHHKQSGHQPQTIFVPTVGLDNLFKLLDGDIHWLKIDVEGMEADVLRSWRKSPVRPWILVIESTFPNSEEPTHHLWIDEVVRRGYKQAFFDGLSRYFVHETHADLADRLNRPANVFDAYQVTLQHFSAKDLREEASSLQQASDAREAQQAALVLEQRERIRSSAMDLDRQREQYALLESRSAAEMDEARARIEAAETAIAANSEAARVKNEFARAELASSEAARARLEAARTQLAADGEAARARIEAAETALTASLARLDELLALQRETSADIDKLNADLNTERETRVALDAEVAEIAKLADADLANVPGFNGALRSVPAGLAYTAVKSRLHLATRELDLLREQAGRHYDIGQRARDTEVSFLNQRISTLETEVSDARRRLAQFEAAYTAARDRSDNADKDKAQLRSLLDQQTKALDAVKAEAAAIDLQLAASRERIVSIYRSRGGKISSFFGLLPKMAAPALPSITPSNPANDGQSSPADGPSPEQTTEIAVNDVRHVSNLLILNGTTFIDALYRSFLKRAPDRPGRDHFLGRLQAGHGKEAVLIAVATSKEAQAIGAPIEGIAELKRSEARSGGWSSKRDRAVDERLNRLEFTIGEAQSQLLDRLDGIQDSVEQIQAAIVGGTGFRVAAGDNSTGAAGGIRHSIKQGMTIAPPASAPQFIDSLKREVKSSSEALSLGRS